MNPPPERISMEELDLLCERRRSAGATLPAYVGPLRRHVAEGDRRLLRLEYDASPAALRLWSFLLTEEERLHAARAAGAKIIGAMKDLGTVPVMAYALPNVVAFYPDGAWWTPCVMELSDGLFRIAQSLGFGEAFCPVRAMLGAFVNRYGAHSELAKTKSTWPRPFVHPCAVRAHPERPTANRRLKSARFARRKTPV